MSAWWGGASKVILIGVEGSVSLSKFCVKCVCAKSVCCVFGGEKLHNVIKITHSSYEVNYNMCMLMGYVKIV